MSTTAQGFDLDGRVRARAQEEIKIGGRVFHPRKQDWETICQIDTAERAQARTIRRVTERADELRPKVGELEDAGNVEEADKLLDELRDGQRDTMLATANVLAVQIMDDKGKSPTPEFVFEHLDFGLIEDLVAYLNPRRDDDEGPDPSR